MLAAVEVRVLVRKFHEVETILPISEVGWGSLGADECDVVGRSVVSNFRFSDAAPLRGVVSADFFVIVSTGLDSVRGLPSVDALRDCGCSCDVQFDFSSVFT